ncbi:MAG: serine/threonine protein kinase [Myxococcota bacterium]|jgi:serine/threonine protein kinase
MGEAWQARHRMLARPAAIQLIRADTLGVGDTAVRRAWFEREAQITATRESPHTVGLYDFGVADDGRFFVVLELLRGVNLRTLVETYGPRPRERVVALLLQACDSLLVSRGP